MDLQKIVSDLQAQGLDKNQIIEACAKMVEEGKITPEDLEKVKTLLSEKPQDENAEKAEACKLFGLKLM